MNFFSYKDGMLSAEEVALDHLAEQVGTRTFVLGTERAASGLLRQADAKAATITRVNRHGKAG